MPQYQDFGFQPPPRLEAVAQHADEKEANCNHATIMLRFAADRESCGQNFRKQQAKFWCLLLERRDFARVSVQPCTSAASISLRL
jgi:hypothetical protein